MPLSTLVFKSTGLEKVFAVLKKCTCVAEACKQITRYSFLQTFIQLRTSTPQASEPDFRVASLVNHV